jgi:hypothetical protein
MCNQVYRGIYDIGFKRGFMGYRGLLLNAPYKIDSMVWMRLGYDSYLLLVLYLTWISPWLYEPGR